MIEAAAIDRSTSTRRTETDSATPITAEELDAMSPDERARVVREHIVTDLDQLPEGFRRRVETTAARLAEQLRPAAE